MQNDFRGSHTSRVCAASNPVPQACEARELPESTGRIRAIPIQTGTIFENDRCDQFKRAPIIRAKAHKIDVKSDAKSVTLCTGFSL
jgi:hypothetical protein